MKAYVVETEKLSYNIELLKERANGVPIWAVVKGDGYGIGILPLAKLLREHGVDHFCVTELSEAQQLRENGFEKEQILMLRQSVDREEIHALMELRVILTVGSLAAADAVEEVAGARSEKAEVHLKVDTGMGRFGFLPSQAEQLLTMYQSRTHMTICGIYTHFDCAFNNDRRTEEEFASFMEVVEAIRAAGYETGTVHCCNSSAFLRHKKMHCDAVRLGSAILGRMAFSTGLKPVGYAEAKIDELRILPKGHSTGYGAIWTAKEDTQIAIVPVGWHNGLHVSCRSDVRTFSDCLRAILRGVRSIFRRDSHTVRVGEQRCPVVGAVGMLHIAVDVSKVNCKVGDLVRMEINPLHVKGMQIEYR